MPTTTTDEEVAEATVRELEQRRYQLLVDGDAQGFGSLCHPDLVFLHASGETETRDSLLTKLASRAFVYQEVDHPLHTVSVSEGTAVVLGDVIAELVADGQTVKLRNRVVSTWTQTSAGWQLIGHSGLPLTAH